MIFIIIRVIALLVFAISFYKAYLCLRAAAGFHNDYIVTRERNAYHADEYKARSNKEFASGLMWSIIAIVCAIFVCI